MSSPRRLNRPVATVVLIVIASLGAVNAQSTPAADAARVDAVFERFTTPGSPGCAASVTRHGAIVHARGYGLADLEDSVPITPTSVFHVASVSKQFTALAVQLLVNDGELSWDDDIRRHLPELDGLDTSMTLRQLGHHTSGLRDQWSLLQMAGWRFEADVVTQSDVLRLLARQRRLNFAPGTGFLYSNSGYTLLALVVERVSGEPFRSFTTRRIFTPLGMTRTHFHDDHRMAIPDRAYAYAADDQGSYRLALSDVETVGATNLFTTLEDLVLWERNFQTFHVGGRGGLAQLQEPGTLADGRRSSYALGLVLGQHRGARTVGHGGTHAGYKSEVVRFPDQNLSVAVLCNLRSVDPARLARTVADVYLTETRASDRRDSRQAQVTMTTRGAAAAGLELTSLTGYYRRADSDVPLRFAVRDGALATIGTLRALTLAPLDGAGDRFRVAGSEGSTAHFLQDAGAIRLELRQGGLDPAVVYERAPAWRPTRSDLETYVGRYESPELDVAYDLRMRGDRLVLSHRTLGTIPLATTYRDGFSGGALYLAMTRDPQQRITGLTASTEQAWKVRFDRLAQ